MAKETRCIVLDGDATDTLRLLSIMAFPEKAQEREQWFELHCADFVQYALKEEEKYAISKNDLHFLINAPPIERMKETAIKNVQKAVIAGDLIALMYLMNQIGFHEPSLNKALHVSKKFAEGRSHPDGKKLNTSKPKIRECLNSYRSVSHIWAALRLMPPSLAAETDLRPEAVVGILNEYRNELLAAAKGVLEFCSTFTPTRSRSTKNLIDKENAWLISEEIEATHFIADPETKQEVEDSLNAALIDYDANEYNSNYL